METKTEKKDTSEHVRVLRFFGADDADRAAVLKELTADGRVWYEEMRKGSEVLVALECKPDAKSTVLLDHCQEKLQKACSPAMYATNEITLAQATIMVLQVQDKLFVAADAETSALLESRLEKLEGVQAVFDFGGQSYNHPRFADKIEEGGAFGRANASDPVLAAQGRVHEAFRLSGADFAISCVPLKEGGSVVLLGAKKGFWQRKLLPTENAALWMLDMLRRAALDKPQACGTSWQCYGTVEKGEAAAAQRSVPAAEQDYLKAYSYLPPREAVPTPTPEEILGTQSPVRRAAPQPEQASQRSENAGLPRKKKNGTAVLLIALLVTVVAAAAGIALLWGVSGGDPIAYWNAKLFSASSVNGASLM